MKMIREKLLARQCSIRFSRRNHDSSFISKSFQIIEHLVDRPGIQTNATGNDVGEVQFALASPFQQERQFLSEMVGDAYDFSFFVDEFAIGSDGKALFGDTDQRGPSFDRERADGLRHRQWEPD